MALTVNKNIARGLNTLGYWVGTLLQVTGDASYPAGGYPFTASMIKLGVIEYMAPIVCQAANGLSIVIAVYNATTGKLQFYWGSGGGGGATLTLVGGQAPGIAVQVTPDSAAGVLGKTTAGDIAIPFALGAAALTEVPATTNLATYSGIGLAFGKG